MARSINEAGLALLRRWEQGPDGGPALRPYYCSAGAKTIAYGHRIRDGERFDSITEPQADELLRRDVARFALCVEKWIKAPLSDNQFAALVCLCFNIGELAFIQSSVAKALNKTPPDYEAVPDAFRLWHKLTDPRTKKLVPCEGLKNRREAEIALWLSPSAPEG